MVALLNVVSKSYAYCCQFGVPCDASGLNLGGPTFKAGSCGGGCITPRACLLVIRRVPVAEP